MPYRPFTDQNCSVAAALGVIGERWTLLIMREVLFGRRRFAEIKRNTGIAANILSDRLQMLVEHGMMSAEQLEAAVDELRATAGIESGLANLARRRVTDKAITAQILSGDTEAFKRRLAAEEEDQ